MRVEYDPDHDVMNIEFLAEGKIADSAELDGIIIDYDKERRIVSLEILDVSKRITRSPLDKIDFAVTKS